MSNRIGNLVSSLITSGLPEDQTGRLSALKSVKPGDVVCVTVGHDPSGVPDLQTNIANVCVGIQWLNPPLRPVVQQSGGAGSGFFVEYLLFGIVPNEDDSEEPWARFESLCSQYSFSVASGFPDASLRQPLCSCKESSDHRNCACMAPVLPLACRKFKP